MATFSVLRRQGAFWVVNNTGSGAVSFDAPDAAQACADDLNAAVDSAADLSAQETWRTLAAVIERHKEINRPAPVAPKAMTEAELQSKIVKALEKAGAYVDRINSGHLEFEGRHIQMGKRGTPDLLALLPGGRAWFIEVKTPTGRVSEIQAKRHEVLRLHGAIVDVVRSVEEVKALWEGYRDG